MNSLGFGNVAHAQCAAHGTMALRFLLPITAPTPERPAARCRSLTTAANSTWFSPAPPMLETRQQRILVVAT